MSYARISRGERTPGYAAYTFALIVSSIGVIECTIVDAKRLEAIASRFVDIKNEKSVSGQVTDVVGVKNQE